MNSADFAFGEFFVRPRHPRSPWDLRNSPGLSFLEILRTMCFLSFLVVHLLSSVYCDLVKVVQSYKKT